MFLQKQDQTAFFSYCRKTPDGGENSIGLGAVLLYEPAIRWMSVQYVHEESESWSNSL